MHAPVFVTGGSGFVGSAVIDELVRRDHPVKALVNRKPLDPRGGRVESVKADLFDMATLAGAMEGCAAVIHLVGIILERPAEGVTFDRIHYQGTKSVVDAAKAAGVRRYVQMSALGTRADAISAYHKTKWKAEEYVHGSGLDWTILRPSMIHGPRGEFTKMEAAWARKQSAPFLFMPYFGGGVLGTGGAGKLQPVFVDDVARAFVDAIEKAETIGGTYPLAGPQELTWPHLHRAMSTAVVGKPRATLAIPAWYARLLTHVAPAKWLPFNLAQVQMSQEDNTADIAPFVQAFGWTPRSFEETLKGYAAQL